MSTADETGYELEGTLLEACSCGVLCPCWIGEDPDHGTCESFNAYHFDRGTIGGVDVSGLAIVKVCLIPGNVLTPGSWRVVMYIDERATDEQFEAIRAAFGGELGGPLARSRRAGRRGHRGRAGPDRPRDPRRRREC